MPLCQVEGLILESDIQQWLSSEPRPVHRLDKACPTYSMTSLQQLQIY